MSRTHLIPVALSLVVFASPGHSFGIRVDDQGPLATARGNAFTATADDPSGVYYNPAGITQLKTTSLQVGGYSLVFDVEYENLDGEDFSNDAELQIAPYAHAVVPLVNLPLTLGFSVHAPFGLENNWPDDTTFSSIATESSFRYLRFSPVVAWEISDQWSVAAGLTLNDGRADLRRMHPLAGEVKLEGDDQVAGYVLGLHYRLSERHMFGATYRSRTRFDLEGTMAIGAMRTSVEAEFPFPDTVVVGYSYRPTPAWNLEFNLDWTNWDVLDTVTVVADNGMRIDMPFEWKSSLIYKFGATRYLDNKLRISAGYMFSENSVPEETFSPTVPDADRHLLSAGIGRSYDHFAWDLGYQFGYTSTRHVRGSQSPPGSPETADGDYQSIVHALTSAISYSF